MNLSKSKFCECGRAVINTDMIASFLLYKEPPIWEIKIILSCGKDVTISTTPKNNLYTQEECNELTEKEFEKLKNFLGVK